MTARPVRIALFALLAIGILFLFVFPTRSYMAQRAEVRDARNDVEAIQEQIVRLQEEAARLRTPAEIERLARQQFNMVFSGERPFQVVPQSDDEDAP